MKAVIQRFGKFLSAMVVPNIGVFIAGIGDEHLDLLGKISEALDNEEVLEKMKKTSDVNWILEQL